MPYTALVLTCGISCLSPRNLVGKWLRQSAQAHVTFPDNLQNPEPANASDPDSTLQCCVRDFQTHVNLADLCQKPDCISAEYSILHALKQQDQLGRGAVVHLIHTPSFGGKLAVEILKLILESHFGVTVLTEELSIPFNTRDPKGLTVASGAFIGVVSRLLKDKNHHSTAFAPIGGYKVMVALGHVAASFHGFPCLYLHEDTQILQELSPSPIAFPLHLKEQLGALARKIGLAASWTSLSKEEQVLVQENAAFFAHSGDLLELNALGHYLRLNEPPVYLSKQAKESLFKNPDLISQQIKLLLSKIQQDPDYVGINHDLEGVKGKRHPWRLARMGLGHRIQWQLEERGVLIGEIWRDHDKYNKIILDKIKTSLPNELGKGWEPYP